MTMTSSFRRSAAVESKKKGGRGGGSWHDRFKLPQNTPSPFLMVAGDYLDPNPPPELAEMDPATGRAKEVRNAFHKRKKHARRLFENGKETFMDEECSAGYEPHNPQPCVGCAAMDQGDKSIKLTDQFAFTIFHLVPYHSAPVIQKDGQIMMRKDNTGPVVNYFECEGRTCNFCRVQAGHPPIVQHGQQPWPNYHPSTIGNKFGHRRYIEMGKGHLSNLEGWDLTVSSLCGNCNSQLTTDGFSCPSCNSLIINLDGDPRTDQQIQEAVSKPYPCMTCQKAVMAKEVITCDFCASKGQTARQNGLFDVVVWGMRQGEGTKSQLMLSRFETIETFEQRMDPNMRAALQGKSLKEYLGEQAQPYNFDEMFKPKDLAGQAKRLRLPMPGGGYPQPQGYGQQGQYPAQPYGAPPNAQQFYGGMPAAPQPQYAPQYQQQPVQAAPQGYPPQQPQYAPVAQPQYAPVQQTQTAPQYAPVQQPQFQPPQPQQPQFAPYPQQTGPQAQPAAAPFPVPGKPNYSA